jgi:hypothetical protein
MLIVFLFCANNANALYVALNVNDSRLQSKNWIYKPSGIIGFSIESGFFDEPENLVDYKLSIGIKRFGYSFDNGDGVLSFWGVDLKPCTWSIIYKKVMLEAYPSISWHFAQQNLRKRMYEHGFKKKIDQKRFAPGYGYRLGYHINEHILVALYADYKIISWDYQDFSGVDSGLHPDYYMGGLGLSLQWKF